MYTMRALSQERTSPGFSGKKRIRQRPSLLLPTVVVLGGITPVLVPEYYSAGVLLVRRHCHHRRRVS